MHGLALHACERCACACGEGSREHWRGVRRATVGCGARSRCVRQARSRRALCRGQDGKHTAALQGTWADLRGERTL